MHRHSNQEDLNLGTLAELLALRSPPIKAAVIAMAAICLAACSALESREITDCETSLTAKLKSPASYKRISADRTFMDIEKPQQVWVDIEYDAVNSFNAPLRDHEFCKYPATKTGQVDWQAYDRQLAADADEAVAAATAAVADADKAMSAAGDAKAAAEKAADQAEREANRALATARKGSKYPYVAPDGVDILNGQDEANWEKYGTTDPQGGE